MSIIKPAPRMRRSSSASDRGVVAVEFVILLPILFFIVLAPLEIGLAWSTRANTTEALRNGTLVAATRSVEHGSDLKVIEAVIAEIGDNNVGDVLRVFVYDPDVADLNVCGVYANTGGFGSCVVYTQLTVAQVATGAVTAANFGTTVCQPPDLDLAWCSENRASSDRIAVRVDYRHQWVTGILPGSGVTFSDHAELRVLSLD